MAAATRSFEIELIGLDAVLHALPIMETIREERDRNKSCHDDDGPNSCPPTNPAPAAAEAERGAFQFKRTNEDLSHQPSGKHSDDVQDKSFLGRVHESEDHSSQN